MSEVVQCIHCGRHTLGLCRCSRVEPKPPVRFVQTQAAIPALETVPYNHWQPLHQKKNATPEWFAKWESQIPCSFCRENYKKIRIEPRFGDDWFEFTWQLHNAVNEHVGYKLQSLDDAKACWLHEAPKRSDRLIVTIATGKKYAELLSLTRPAMERYASRCHADFVAITNQMFPQWQREKFRVYDFAQQYKQTLFIDVDCIIKPDCDDLFALYPDSIAMHDDLPENSKVTDLSWARNEISGILHSQNVELYPVQRILNSGVVLCTNTKNPWKPPANDLPNTHCSEQFWVDHQAGPDCKLLPVEYNTQYWMQGFFDRIESAKIVHFANAPIDERIELARQICLPWETK